MYSKACFQPALRFFFFCVLPILLEPRYGSDQTRVSVSMQRLSRLTRWRWAVGWLDFCQQFRGRGGGGWLGAVVRFFCGIPLPQRANYVPRPWLSVNLPSSTDFNVIQPHPFSTTPPFQSPQIRCPIILLDHWFQIRGSVGKEDMSPFMLLKGKKRKKTNNCHLQPWQPTVSHQFELRTRSRWGRGATT